MIDQLTIFLPHALMAIAIWRLLHRDDLDDDLALPRPFKPQRHMRKRAPQTDAKANRAAEGTPRA